MSDLTASVLETKNGFHVDGYEKISYDFTFLDGVFDTKNRQLAECYHKWGRVLAVTDMNVFNMYGEQIEKYFEHYNLELKVHKTKIGEKAKTIPTFLSIVDSMTEFGIYRKVLAILSFRCQTYWVTTVFTDVYRSPYWLSAGASSLMSLGKSILARDDIEALSHQSPKSSPYVEVTC